jgi:hypothetical protein
MNDARRATSAARLPLAQPPARVRPTETLRPALSRLTTKIRHNLRYNLSRTAGWALSLLAAQIVPTDAILPVGSRGFVHLSYNIWCVRTFLTQCAAHAKTDKRDKIETVTSQRDRRCAAGGGSDAPRRHHDLSRPRRQALSWWCQGTQRCGRRVCPFVPIPAVMVLMMLTGW